MGTDPAQRLVPVAESHFDAVSRDTGQGANEVDVEALRLPVVVQKVERTKHRGAAVDEGPPASGRFPGPFGPGRLGLLSLLSLLSRHASGAYPDHRTHHDGRARPGANAAADSS